LAVDASQQGTINTKLFQLKLAYNDQQQVCLTCLKMNNAYNKLHDLESNVNKCKLACNISLSNTHYVSAFTTTKPDHTPCEILISLRVVAVLSRAQQI